MTKFITLEQEQKETVFTHYLSANKGWSATQANPNEYKKVVYLGRCLLNGDMFSAYAEGQIIIFKGIKGSEFNK